VRPGLDDILRGTPWLDELTACEFKGIIGPWRVGRTIKQTGADAVLLLPNSFRSAFAARLSRAPIRIGYARDLRGVLLTHRIHPPRQRPIPAVEYYAALAEFALGVSSIDRRIELHCTADEETAAEYMIRDVPRPYIVLNPGANRSDKRWPARNFALVADALASSHRVSILITGSPGETEVLDEVVRNAKSPIINLAQRDITLGSLKSVLRHAAMLITNDTGPRHIAAALGTPVIALFGPTDHRWTTLAGAPEQLLLADPFLPEHLVADDQPKLCAIDKITVNDVLHAARRFL
jgi:heptosyltransferase-2